jgi:hypothetical protein
VQELWLAIFHPAVYETVRLPQSHEEEDVREWILYLPNIEAPCAPLIFEMGIIGRPSGKVKDQVLCISNHLRLIQCLGDILQSDHYILILERTVCILEDHLLLLWL